MISFDIRIAFLAQEDEKLEETCQRHLKCSGPFEATPLRLWHNSQLAQPTTVLYCWFKYIIVFLSHKAATLQAQCHSSPHGNRLLRLRPSSGCCPDLPTPEMLRNENIFNVMKSSFGVQQHLGVEDAWINSPDLCADVSEQSLICSRTIILLLVQDVDDLLSLSPYIWSSMA